MYKIEPESMVELAANDDLEGMERLLSEGSASLQDTEPWYCRRSCSSRLSLLHRTPLMVACLNGNCNTIAFILKVSATSGGVDINFRSSSDGCTALHCAAMCGSPRASEIVASLLRNGARKDLPDCRGKLPLDAITVSPKLPHLKSALERMLKPGCDAPITPFVTVPTSPDLSPPEAPSSPSSTSPNSPKVSPSSPSSGSDNSGGVPQREYPFDPTLPDIRSSFYTSDEFRMYSFKVRPCSRAYSHDWTECPFVHPGENARRRDPRRYSYSCVPCPDFRKGACKRGDACEYAHGVFECWLHPAQYRTRLCKDGTSCARRVCFFAHTPEELRPLHSLSTSSASPRAPNYGDMRSIASSADIPPPSPSSVLIMGGFGSSSSTPTAPISPSANASLWAHQRFQAAAAAAAAAVAGSGGSTTQASLAAAAAGLNLSRLRSALFARELTIPEDAELLGAAALQQQLAVADVHAALMADAYAKLSLAGAPPPSLLQNSTGNQVVGATGSLASLPLAPPAQMATPQGRLQEGAGVGNINDEALASYLAGAHNGREVPGGKLSLSLEDSYGLIPGMAHDMRGLSRAPLSSATPSGALNLASPRVPQPSRTHRLSQPSFPLEHLGPAAEASMVGPGFMEFGPVLQGQMCGVQQGLPGGEVAASSMAGSGWGMVGTSPPFAPTRAISLPSHVQHLSEKLADWGSPAGLPDWGTAGGQGSFAAATASAVSRASTPGTIEGSLFPQASLGSSCNHSRHLEQDLDALWMQDMGPVSGGLGSLNNDF